MIATTGGVRDHPEVVWDSRLFDGVVGVPWDPLAKGRGNDASEPHERVADLPRVVVPRSSDDGIPKARNVVLDRSYFDKFGFTHG